VRPRWDARLHIAHPHRLTGWLRRGSATRTPPGCWSSEERVTWTVDGLELEVGRIGDRDRVRCGEVCGGIGD
jgi:hypothetical protein